MNDTDPTQALAEFAAGLRFDAIPPDVIRRTEDLFLDWFASALAGKGARPVESIARFIETMGPEGGPSDILIHRRIWNWRAIDYSTMQYAMFLVMRDIRGKSAEELAKVLGERLATETEVFARPSAGIVEIAAKTG